MKLSNILEASKGEHAVNFTDDLSKHDLPEERNDLFTRAGANLIKAGFDYLEGKMKFVFKRGEEEVTVKFTPALEAMDLEVVNDFDQKFTWSNVNVKQFDEMTELNFAGVRDDMLSLMVKTEEISRYIGNSPTFEN